jgi:beta-glucanase (GH16 family)
MKKFNCILLLLILGYSCFGAIILSQILHDYPRSYPANGNWTLVWDDEFDGATLDRAKWEEGVRSCDYSDYRKEVQKISNKNVNVKDSCLVLTANSTSWRDSDNVSYTTRFTSGQVASGDKCAWKYGRFEIRAKLPPGEGLLSYIDLYPVNNDFAREILTMMVREGDSSIIFMHDIYGTDRQCVYLEEVHSNRSIPDSSAGFHTFAVEWETRSIRWYIDDVKIYQTRRNVPEVPLSLALGTTAGDLHLYHAAKVSGNVSLPQYCLVDWVRVYQRR